MRLASSGGGRHSVLDIENITFRSIILRHQILVNLVDLIARHKLNLGCDADDESSAANSARHDRDTRNEICM